jgi:[ribosomal protein S5]-alanine N-acetyltransferase
MRMPDLLPVVETRRLILRAFQPGDAGDLAANMTPAVTRWLSSWPSPMSEAMALAPIERSQAATRRGGHAFYALARKSDDRVIGGFGGGIGAQGSTRAELSYHLAEDCHRQGYMREATDAAMPVLWRLLPVEAMEAGAQVDNAASFAVMRALGMTPIDQRLVYSPIRDRHEPTQFYELRRAG